jgi:hypothetical protein
MADVKISGLPASTVPLAGTEVLPIVQSGATKQVSIANVTAGRAIAATSITTNTYKAASSSGGALQNSGGTPQLQWGAGGGNNLSVDVAININPANAAVAISPTGTGTVAISPAGALTVNPTAASTMNNVAIGGTTPLAGAFTTLSATGVATVSAGSVSAPAITTTGDTNTGIFFPAADTIAFTEGGAESLRIFASGGVSIGNTTDPGATNLSVNGSLFVGTTAAISAGKQTISYTGATANGLIISESADTASTTFLAFNIGSSVIGSVVRVGATSAVVYQTTSDYRLKTVIGSVADAGQRIDALEPIEYDWNTGGRTRGFLAHKFAQVYPNSVTGEKDAIDKDGKPIYQGMQAATSEVMADLIAEIQSLRKRVAQLESK